MSLFTSIFVHFHRFLSARLLVLQELLVTGQQLWRASCVAALQSFVAVECISFCKLGRVGGKLQFLTIMGPFLSCSPPINIEVLHAYNFHYSRLYTHRRCVCCVAELPWLGPLVESAMAYFGTSMLKWSGNKQATAGNACRTNVRQELPLCSGTCITLCSTITRFGVLWLLHTFKA